MTSKPAAIPPQFTSVLMLEDGKTFFGYGIGSKGEALGEICFNTGLTGYQETLTDPSYAGQIITFTFPHIGNIGTNAEDNEGNKVAAKGLVIREEISDPSNFRSDNHLHEWLTSQHVVGISGIDTRALTRHIRNNGAQNAIIMHASSASDIDLVVLREKIKAHPSLEGMELAKQVTCKEAYAWNQTHWKLGEGFGTLSGANYKVVVVDYGVKHNILRCLASVGCDLTVVPADTPAAEILAQNPDGVFLSNGPGDPEASGEYAEPIIKELVASCIPLFGICFGHQLLCRALGCKTEKMYQGHRGANHPVQDLTTKRVEITSQNHGFVVTKDLPDDDIEITHRSLFDNTVEGVRSKSRPIFTVQYHPEASPGPSDSFYLFERFVQMMEKR